MVTKLFLQEWTRFLDVELRLSRVVAIVQQRLLSCDDLPATSSPAKVTEILENIENLQDKLKVSTQELATCATQSTATVEEKGLTTQDQAYEIRTEDIQDSDSETETKDGDHESSGSN